MDLTGLGSISDFAKGIMDRFLPKKMDESERAKTQLELEAVLSDREEKAIAAKSAIIVAELQQGDNFTKRARPWVVYGGLIFIGINHVLFPAITAFADIAYQIACVLWKVEMVKIVMPTLSLPEQFWWAWGSVVSVWELGRTWEKSHPGVGNKLVNLITGGK